MGEAGIGQLREEREEMEEIEDKSVRVIRTRSLRGDRVLVTPMLECEHGRMGYAPPGLSQRGKPRPGYWYCRSGLPVEERCITVWDNR